ncbi:MAG: Na+/H+ antiporter NhaC family protein, partial [Candidatus Marinimicrobia bacterium]|nr:Na+/H+ antiporter NhaC family protein [Candidatus Neomarinimicrobiota bacterium]
PFFGFLRTIDSYLIRAVTDPDHMKIVLFTMTLGGMVGIISRSGGTHGIVVALAKYASDRRKGQLATWLMGLLIFFDDYSNSLLVGNTMRPFTDKLKISREKLSYLVDSTSAPIASIALASTWIGFELGLINSSFKSLGIEGNAYVTFIGTIPYSFYSIMALVMVPLLAWSGRDYGPMYAAEQRARNEGKVLRDGATPLLDKELANLMPPEGVTSHWSAALLPIVSMITILISGLYLDGLNSLGTDGHRFREVIGAADSFKVLIWAAFGGTVVAGTIAVGRRILSVHATVDAFLVGFKAMIVGIIILTLARSLQHITGDLHTADYIFYVTEDILNPRLLPAITFIVAALTSFSTGTSWGTMAILVPLVIPLAHTLPLEAGLADASREAIFLGSLASILSGSIFGDHCSP